MQSEKGEDHGGGSKVFAGVNCDCCVHDRVGRVMEDLVRVDIQVIVCLKVC